MKDARGFTSFPLGVFFVENGRYRFNIIVFLGEFCQYTTRRNAAYEDAYSSFVKHNTPTWGAILQICYLLG